VLEAEVYNKEGFVMKDTCVSSAQLCTPIWKKESLSSTCKTEVA
jgi:hypothetical protein